MSTFAFRRASVPKSALPNKQDKSIQEFPKPVKVISKNDEYLAIAFFKPNG